MYTRACVCLSFLITDNKNDGACNKQILPCDNYYVIIIKYISTYGLYYCIFDFVEEFRIF